MAQGKQTSQSPRRPATSVSKFLRRLRKVSARTVTDRLPAVSRQWQRFRYRNWVQQSSGGELVRPDFIIVGAPKCGTSWLQGALRHHPNVIMVPDEIEYFSLHLDLPFAWYCEHFTRQLESPRRKREPYLLGERSARYCAMPPENIRRLKSLLPDARLILMTRDPVSRHWAHAKNYFAKRRLKNPDGAVLSLPRRKLLAFFETMRPLGEFSTIVANWTSVYPNGELLVLSQEKTLTAPKLILDAVRAHIGLAADYDPGALDFMSEHRNQGPKVPMPDDVAAVLEDMFAGERQWLRDFFGDRPFVHAMRRTTSPLIANAPYAGSSSAPAGSLSRP